VSGPPAIPAVMGRSAVNITVGFLFVPGVLRWLGIDVSGVVDRGGSGQVAEHVWASMFVFGGASLLWARRTGGVEFAVQLEILASLAVSSGLGFYLYTLLNEVARPTAASIPVALCAAAIVNLVGRTFFLVRAAILYRRAFR